MLRYTLRQLDYFVTTAELGSVANAAARLNVSQPSVSTAIAKLEAQFGVQLFIRHHAQGVSLTPVGRRLLANARALLRHATELQQNAEAAGEIGAGQLELGCFVPLAPAYMPALITAFSEVYPGVRIRLHEGVQDELVAGLTSGRFELALLYDLEIPEEFHLEVLAAAKPYALLPKGHALARRKAVSLAELAAEPMILLDVPPSRHYFTGLFRAAGLEPRITFSSPSFELVRGLVGQGRGCSILVTRPRQNRTYDGQEIVTRPLSDPVEASDICLARLAQGNPTRLMKAFTTFCRAWFANPENLAGGA
jgi:DNA-binding transcriptional LysR family regulator